MRTLSLIILLFAMSSCTVQQIQQTIGDYLEETDELSVDQVSAGLKEALVKGAGTSVSQASSTNGFLVIPLSKFRFLQMYRKWKINLEALD